MKLTTKFLNIINASDILSFLRIPEEEARETLDNHTWGDCDYSLIQFSKFAKEMKLTNEEIENLRHEMKTNLDVFLVALDI